MALALALVLVVGCSGDGDGDVTLPTSTSRPPRSTTTTTAGEVTTTTEAAVTTTTQDATTTTAAPATTTTAAPATTTTTAAPTTTTTEAPTTTTTSTSTSTTTTTVEELTATVIAVDTEAETEEYAWLLIPLLIAIGIGVFAYLSHRRHKEEQAAWGRATGRAVSEGRVIVDELGGGALDRGAREPAIQQQLQAYDAALVTLQAKAPSAAGQQQVAAVRGAVAELSAGVASDLQLRLGPPPPTPEQLEVSDALLVQRARGLDTALDRLALAAGDGKASG